MAVKRRTRSSANTGALLCKRDAPDRNLELSRPAMLLLMLGCASFVNVATANENSGLLAPFESGSGSFLSKGFVPTSGSGALPTSGSGALPTDVGEELPTDGGSEEGMC